MRVTPPGALVVAHKILSIMCNPELFLTRLYCESAEFQRKHWPTMRNHCTLKEFSPALCGWQRGGSYWNVGSSPALCGWQKGGSYWNVGSSPATLLHTATSEAPLTALTSLLRALILKWKSNDLQVLVLRPMSLLTGGCTLRPMPLLTGGCTHHTPL